MKTHKKCIKDWTISAPTETKTLHIWHFKTKLLPWTFGEHFINIDKPKELKKVWNCNQCRLSITPAMDHCVKPEFSWFPRWLKLWLATKIENLISKKCNGLIIDCWVFVPYGESAWQHLMTAFTFLMWNLGLEINALTIIGTENTPEIDRCCSYYS